MHEIGNNRGRVAQWSGDWSMTDRERAALVARSIDAATFGGRVAMQSPSGHWYGTVRPHPADAVRRVGGAA